MSLYFIPKQLVTSEYEIKKSRFICWIAPASSREDALKLVDQAKAEYPDARHHCWAYIIGNPVNATSAATYDDGEPSGTAGKPILNVIQHKNIGDVVAIVIRYFGGIKLGAGGLVRAYSTATQLATEHLTLIEQIPYDDLTIECEYADEPEFRRWLVAHEGKLLSSQHHQNVVLKLSIPSTEITNFYALIKAREGVRVKIKQV